MTDTAIPTIIGTPFEGGFYAGRFLIDDQIYALIIAPKAEGETSLVWKTKATGSKDARSLRDGFANSEAINNKSHPGAQFCRSLSIGGFDDWYLPSRHEAALLAEAFMPGDGYVPEQTTAKAFQAGGTEAFEQGWYWTSTEFSPGYAWLQSLYFGFQDLNYKGNRYRVRAVRKCPL